MVNSRRKNKAKKAEIANKNRRQGAWGEALYESISAIQGKQIERTGKGSDYAEIERDSSGKKSRTLVDVKTGNATRSDLQKKKGAKVVRIETYGVEEFVPDEVLLQPKKKHKKK